MRDVCQDLSTPQLGLACHIWGEELPLPQPVQATLFRLAQELAHNIVRHAGARLELETLAGIVSLRAEDLCPVARTCKSLRCQDAYHLPQPHDVEQMQGLLIVGYLTKLLSCDKDKINQVVHQHFGYSTTAE